MPQGSAVALASGWPNPAADNGHCICPSGGEGWPHACALSPDNGCALCAWAGQWELLGEWKLLQRRLNEANSRLCTFLKQKEQCPVELQLKYHRAQM